MSSSSVSNKPLEMVAPVPQRLVDVVESGEVTPDPRKSVTIYPATWVKWIRPEDTPGVRWFDPTQPKVTIERQDLVTLAGAIDTDDPVALRGLFAATMMWGSGPWNGRGPRYTAQALADHRLADTLRDTRYSVLHNEPEDAYARFKVNGIGPSFFTKWFWAAGLGSRLEVKPLVLDERVWASLSALGWNSVVAAGGSRLRKRRYRAYLDTCALWAADKPKLFGGPEDVENVLFQWAGGRRDRRRGSSH
jgi:hypothetical protein